MNKRDSMAIFTALALLLGIFMLVKYDKTSFWWWVLLIFILVPAMGRVGWAVGTETYDIKKHREACQYAGGQYFTGFCYDPDEDRYQEFFDRPLEG